MSAIYQGTTFAQTFILVSSVDHISPVTGAIPAVSISKAGGAFAPVTGTVSELSSGWYVVALTSSDTNTLGDLSFHITASGADNTDFNAQVVAVPPTPPPPPPTPPAPVVGGFTFNPTIGRLTLNAFGRCQIRRPMIGPEHMEDAWLECNLLQADWAADGITWWSVELVTQALTPGTATYTVPANAVSVLDVYINNGSSNRLIFPFSRTDYASLAEPNEQGFPTSFWWNRVIPSTLTLWPVPDNTTTYTMSYYVYTQTRDATIQQGGNAAIPYFWLNAYTADLAHRLSRIYAPTLEAQREKDKIIAYNTACKQVENAPIFVTPGLAGYFR